MEQWVDSVGSMKGGMLHNETGKCGGDGYYLLCFFENSVLKYHTPSYESCYVVIGVENRIESSDAVSIHPNPLTDISGIRIGGKYTQSPFIIKFYDATGRLVSTYGFTQELQISRHSFNPGLYYFTVTSNGQKSCNGKMMVE